MPELMLYGRGQLEVVYVSKAERIKVPKWHCKVCHHSWFPRSEDPPDRCANVTGYTDDDGKFVEACGTRRWHIWPEGFDPSTCQCNRCLQVYYNEKAEKEELAKSNIKAVNS